MLICTPGKRNEAENVGNLATVIRHNISRNDHSRAFNLSGGDHTIVENNVIYIGPGIDLQVLAVTNWQGWASDVVFRGNTFWAQGTARYGHEVNGTKMGLTSLRLGGVRRKESCSKGTIISGGI